MHRRFVALILLFSLFSWSCDRSENGVGDITIPNTVRITGSTMGTTWSVVMRRSELLGSDSILTNEVAKFDLSPEAIKHTLDSAMIALNNEVSNWEEGSTVVRFNASESGIGVSRYPHFLANYELARRAHQRTAGAFEPTILPLTDYWGFGSGRERIEAGVDTAEVQRRLARIGMDKIELVADTFLRKLDPTVLLDLGGSAKGYGVDLMVQILRERYGLKNFLVEIGGEMYAAGRKTPSQRWRVGINLPREDAALNALAEAMPLEDAAVATSGNYRNFYRVEGEVYSHTLNPRTGFPERNRLLSASVIAPDCATADAFATACMVLGPQGARQLIEDQADLEAYFLVSEAGGTMQPVFSSGLDLTDKNEQ